MEKNHNILQTLVDNINTENTGVDHFYRLFTTGKIAQDLGINAATYNIANFSGAENKSEVKKSINAVINKIDAITERNKEIFKMDFLEESLVSNEV